MKSLGNMSPVRAIFSRRCRTPHVVAVNITGRSNRYVREHPSTALSNIRPDRLSSWIPRYYPGELFDVHLVFLDDVPVLVDFQRGFEFGAHGDVHGVRQRLGEMYLDKQVAFCMRWKHAPSHASGVRSKPKNV